MRALIGLACAGLLFALAGCAAAVPGYAPPNSRTKLPTQSVKTSSEPQTPATVAADGTYAPSAKERGLNCRRLTGVVQIKIQQVRDIEASPTPTGLLSSVTGAAKPRPATGSAAVQERAQLTALNNLMIEKSCGRFDLDAALAPGNTETPEPIKPEGKKAKKRS